MSDESSKTTDVPNVHIQLLIRKIIFDKFNDSDLKFTNDEIFKIIKTDHSNLLLDDVCDMESDFESLCESGLMRNIAQNFNTIWFKLFDIVEELPQCNSCSNVVYLGKSEERKCSHPACGKSIA